MGGMLLTDKLVLRWLEGFGNWSLDSATPVTSAYPAHASRRGSSVISLAKQTNLGCLELWS